MTVNEARELRVGDKISYPSCGNSRTATILYIDPFGILFKLDGEAKSIHHSMNEVAGLGRWKKWEPRKPFDETVVLPDQYEYRTLRCQEVEPHRFVVCFNYSSRPVSHTTKSLQARIDLYTRAIAAQPQVNNPSHLPEPDPFKE
jgi:hypothetical protein